MDYRRLMRCRCKPEPTDEAKYHALDYLRAVQCEERQERRGLETRASANIAASLAVIAFSGNAIADELHGAEALAIFLLSFGTAIVFLGVVLNTRCLLGSRMHFGSAKDPPTSLLEFDLDRALKQADRRALQVMRQNMQSVPRLAQASAAMAIGVALLVGGVVVLLG
jgi:hypothetical protein